MGVGKVFGLRFANPLKCHITVAMYFNRWNEIFETDSDRDSAWKNSSFFCWTFLHLNVWLNRFQQINVLSAILTTGAEISNKKK